MWKNQLMIANIYPIQPQGVTVWWCLSADGVVEANFLKKLVWSSNYHKYCSQVNT